MRIRLLISRIAVVAGLAAAGGGYLYAWNSDDIFVGTVWMVLGIGLMASAAIYSMAMDDPESRETALTTHRRRADRKGPDIDLRDHDTVRAARERAKATSRVGV